jgi:hypothetical protein
MFAPAAIMRWMATSWASTDVPPDASVTTVTSQPSPQAWITGFGGFGYRDPAGTSPGHRHGMAGIVSGIDIGANEAGTSGILIGGAWERTEVPGSQTVDASSIFGGAYGAIALGDTSIDLGLILGHTRFESTRAVFDNMAAGGIANAQAEYGGVFVSPHVALTQSVDLGGQAAKIGGSVRYSGLFVDGYTETGTAAPLSINARDVHALTARAFVSVPFQTLHDDGALTRITPTLGVEGTLQFGTDTLTGALSGTGFAFSAGHRNTLGAFAGLRLEHQTARNLSLFGEAQGTLRDSRSGDFSASVGVSLKF